MMVESFYLIDFVECEMWEVDALCFLETKFTDPKILYVCNIFIFRIKKVGVVKNT